MEKVIFAFYSGLAAVLVSFFTTGCAVPLLTGLKDYKSADGAEYHFITGADFTFGMNGTDRVNNKRGIAPSNVKY